jgi:hypothetical protein
MATFARSPSALWRALPDRVILLTVEQEVLTLTGTAVEIWDELAEPTSPDVLIDRLAVRYDVEPSEISADVHALLSRLAASGSVESSS